MIESNIWALYVISALLNAFFLLKAYRRESRIARKLGIAMLMNFLMILFYTLNVVLDAPLIQSLGCSIAFIFLDLMLYFYLEYVISYVGWEFRFPQWIRVAVLAYLIIDSVFMLVNPFTGIALSYHRVAFGDGSILTYEAHLLFYAHMVFNVLLILGTIILLLRKRRETPKAYLNRYYGPIISMILALVFYVSYLFGLFPMHMDLTPILYVVVGLMLYFYNFNYLRSATLSITRNMIFEHLEDPIVLFDYEGMLVDHSVILENMLPDQKLENGKLTIDEFASEQSFPGLNGTDFDQEFDWTYQVGGKEKILECRFSCMKDEVGRLIGKLFVFHDVTTHRQTYFELEKSLQFDSVTGFFNKQSFYNQMPQWDDDEYWPTSIVVCNVDGMRGINEAYGTEYGDGVMKQIARYIRRRAGENSFCAKLDNGDIVIVLERTSDADASEIMDNIREEILDFYDQMPVSLEYGISTKDNSESSMEKLLQDARNSMQNKKMLKEKSASSSLVNSLKQTLAESDFQTEEHVERTRKMAARLGREMGLSDAIIGRLELLAALHDIGKVAIPQDIIKKKGKLTAEERNVIEQHTVKGYRIAKSSPELAEIADGILCHHEKWDGTGYPNGLKGEEIPLIARVIAAVDSHDVMVNDRPYHKGMPEADAIAELRRCSGSQFDPHVVEVFTRLLEREELPASLEADSKKAEHESETAEENREAVLSDHEIDIRRLLAE
ncbi:MAG: diguanylate cyclase [Lachnospiraceae bacterium]|nr:diguanylate cyclase [Lachnospiraceae bacterium]